MKKNSIPDWVTGRENHIPAADDLSRKGSVQIDWFMGSKIKRKQDCGDRELA